jgi:phosphatidate cytidylyltransferase
LPFNLQTFKTRTLTAVLFAAVMLTGLFWNAWSFLLLFLVIHFGCWYEFLKLLNKMAGKRYSLYPLLGLVYISLPILMMLDLGLKTDLIAPGRTSIAGHAMHYDPLLPCAIVFSIWINDTMAYLVGSLIGKTPFSTISPKKTWEGTAGGVVLCVLVIALLGHFLKVAQEVPLLHWIAIAAICAISGTAGDLLESKIKRLAQVKDSGNILPGHGGILDRFDSLLVAVPIVWLYVKLFITAQ